MTVRARVRWAAMRIPSFALLLFTLSGAMMLCARIAADFPKLSDIGYPDSYMLYDAEHFRHTGVIYRDPAAPPWPPAIYSPLFYALLSLPARIHATANPFIAPRIIILLAFLACVVVTAAIAHRLVRSASAGVWGVLLAISISTMPGWVLQLRSDFPGAAFSLLSIWLLLRGGQWTVALAGAAAGVAFGFKLTLIAALVAGGLWLLTLRRFRDFGLFAAAGALFGLGPYLYFGLREPHMMAQIFSMTLSVHDYGGLAAMALHSAAEPVCMLAFAALPLVIGVERPAGWRLVLLFASVSLAVALLTGAQAGGNINYFFEGLFALTPLAALAALSLVDTRQAWRTSGVLAAGLLLHYEVLPNFLTGRSVLVNEASAPSHAAGDRPLLILQRALPGHRVLSTVPRVSIMTDNPVLVEPYFLAYAQLQGKFDSGPLVKRIRDHEFEAVVTLHGLGHHRGVPMVPPDVMAAVDSAYVPFCDAGPDFVVHLPPEDGGASVLGAELLKLGCTPRSTGTGPLSTDSTAKRG